jgi:hypothetical protein
MAEVVAVAAAVLARMFQRQQVEPHLLQDKVLLAVVVKDHLDLVAVVH